MLRNRKVGSKIALGFTAVIVAFSVMLSISSVLLFKSIKDMEAMGEFSKLQATAAKLLNSFSGAKAASKEVFGQIDTSEVYHEFLLYVEESEGYIEEMLDFSKKHDNFEIELIRHLETELAAWKEKTAAVMDMDRETARMRDGLIASSVKLGAKSGEMMEKASWLVIENSTNQSMAWLTDRIQHGVISTMRLNKIMEELRLIGADLILTYNFAAVDSLYAKLVEVDSAMATLLEEAATDEARALLTSFQTYIDEYTQSLNNIMGVFTQAQEHVAQANEIMELIDGEVVLLNEAIIAHNTAVINASSTWAVRALIGISIISVIAIVGAVVISRRIGRSISEPLGLMKEMLQQVGREGDMTFSDETCRAMEKYGAYQDETGQSINAWNDLIERIHGMSRQLEQLADGDLTVEFDVLGENDIMGNSLKILADSLNAMFREINNVSQQVAHGSAEIAYNAQNLAQDSTQQAHAMEEITAVVNEISGRANKNAKIATDAVQENESISQIAEEGQRQMEEMTHAVQDINEASQNIKQVIKVIDDIAFQTNILALNATVEAARAGLHGKGFAVVADEVRTLAAKSARAAQETAALVATNMEKAEFGRQISVNTTESLNQIVNDICTISQRMETIAKQSRATSDSTAEVVLAVDEVARVVQKNSASSQESASASQEMSVQAEVLRGLIDRFKLKPRPKKDPPTQGQLVPFSSAPMVWGQENDPLF